MLDKSDYDKGIDEAGGKMSGFADKVKSGVATVAKVGAAGLAATAAAAAALTKAAIDGYAEYEQLTGGVETLFGQSADAVMKYADNAYKTAGMSANQYLQTVTGFSASLLQSMGGDTEAAAQKADQAITDMADNANKMGTSMDMIQNAYGGFAKQNFTMLDNLKLGYGGTKEEMERLLADAEKISGIEYDISSYADIVDAIHVVQTEMGITGATAEEASSTIQGSVSAMKAAWSNLVTGIATDNADIDTLLDNFLTSVETVAGNILPVVQRVLTNIFSTLEKRGPDMIKAATNLFLKIVTGILQALPGIVASIPEIIKAIVGAFKDAWPELKQAGVDLLKGIWSGISDTIGWLKDKVFGVVDTIKGWFTGKDGFDEHSPSKWSNQVFRYVMEGGANGLEDGLPGLMHSVDSVTSRVKNGMDFGTAQVDFASSGLGRASAGTVNGLVSGLSAASGNGGALTVNLVLPDGSKFASWVLPDLIKAANANGTPIAEGQFA